MNDEARTAVKKAFMIGEKLFSMEQNKYEKLIDAVSNITMSSIGEIDSNISLSDTIIIKLQDKYKQAAVEAGFTEEDGLTILQYVSMLAELEESK